MSSQPHLQAVPGAAGTGEVPPTASDSHQASSAGGAAPPSSGSGGAGRAQKQRAERSLPTDRLSFDKQVEVLRAIAQLSGNSRRAVTAEDLSAAIGLKGGTGGLSNKFFRDSGWIDSTGRGTYAATEALLDYHRHLNVDQQDVEGARRYLVPPIKGSWYWETLEPMLDGGVRQTMVLHSLSRAAGAYDHTPQLQLILSWLEWLGLIRRDGECVYPAAVAATAGTADSPAEDATSAEAPADADVAEAADLPESAEQPTKSQQDPPSGGDVSALVSFNFSVRITADDAAKLSAEQLQSLLEFAEKLRG